MKQRTIALLLCLVVLLTGCGKEDKEIAMTGSWEATVGVSLLGERITAGEGQAQCVLELFEDGSCTYSLTGADIPEQNVTLRYQAADGKITFLSSDGSFAEWDCQLEEDTLTLRNDNWKIEFVRK